MDDPKILFNYDKSFLNKAMSIPAADIVQIAELCILRESEIMEHVQICDEITYVISGSATVYSGNNVYEIHAGQIHYIQQGLYHRIVADSSENLRYCCIGYRPNHSCQEIKSFEEAVTRLPDFVLDDDGNFRTLFPLLLDEFNIHDNESRTMIHLYFCLILVHLYRILSGASRDTINKMDTNTAKLAVYRTVKWIDQKYMELTQVREIAQALSYSEYYLCHVFKSAMNITVKDYLMKKKMNMATTLLQTSSMRVTEIADMLSFSSVHSFSLAFKRYVGVAPSVYREQISEELEMV